MRINYRNTTISLVVGWMAVFSGIPLLLLLGVSFLQPDQQQYFLFNFSLSAYKDLLDPGYFQVFLRSVYFAAATTLICLVIGYPFAWFTSRITKKYRIVVLVLLMIPFWTNSLIRTYAVRLLLGTKGVINSALLAAGLIDAPIRMMYTDFAVVLGLVYLMLPFMILPLYANMEKFDHRLVEAARDLGSTALTTFRKIIFPLTLPGILSGCIMVFVPAMGLFYVAFLLGGAKKNLIGNLIQQKFLISQNWPLGSAMSVVLIVMMIFMLGCYGLILKRFSTGRG